MFISYLMAQISHNHRSVNSSIGINCFKSSLPPNIHRERVLANQKVGPTFSIPYLIFINPLFHLIFTGS